MRSPIIQHTAKTQAKLKMQAEVKSDLSDYSDEDITAMVNNLLHGTAPTQPLGVVFDASKDLTTKESVDWVRSFLSEYFKSFLLMGYGIDGKRTIIQLTDTDMDDDAIVELLRYVALNVMKMG